MFILNEPAGNLLPRKPMKPWWRLRSRFVFPEWLILCWRQEGYTGDHEEIGLGDQVEADSAKAMRR